MSRFPFIRPISQVAQHILEKRYLHPGEFGWRDVATRSLSHVWPSAPDDVQDLLINQWFLPNSPTLFNAGIPGSGLSACYVLHTEDSTEGILKTYHDFVQVCRKGGGAGFDATPLRPKGAPVAGSAHGYAAGPVAIIKSLCGIMDAFSEGGRRKFAQMSVLSCEHPDILEFIHCKEVEGGVLAGTNISVRVTDAFMQAVEEDLPWNLVHGGKVYTTVQAREIWDAIIAGAWRNGEPGLIFDDKTNNHSPYSVMGERIYATNPCGITR